MGVDIQTYRARIGTYSNSRGGDVVTVAKQVNIRDGIKTIGCLIFIGILLVMAGIELNPGPREKESSKILEPINVPNVKISGLKENINKMMLETFFELEEKKGGGKIKNIDMDSNEMCARLTFKDKADFAAFMNRKPKSIFGNEVTVEIIDSHADIPCIRIDGLSENANKEMLEMFFKKEERQGRGKVKSIEIDSKNKCATIVFDEKAAVDAFMQRNPKKILGMDVTVKVLAPKLYHAESRCIKITGPLENMNKQILELFFDNEERDGGGKVKSIDLDSKNKCALVEFEDKTGVDRIMKKTPMTIFGKPVHIEVTGDDTEETKMIKISKLPADINEEMLLLFFENKIECDEKVVDVTVNTKASYAIVEFDKSSAVYRVMNEKPFTIFGFEVDVDIFVPDMNPVIEPWNIPRIRISGLKENTNKEMLAMYFELQHRNCWVKVKNIDIDKKGKFAEIEFEDKAGADAFMLRRPKSILGMDVTIEVIAEKVVSQTEHTGGRTQRSESLQTTETGGTIFEGQEHDSSQEYERNQGRRSNQIMTVTWQAEELKKRSMEVVNANKGTKLSGKMIDNLFEDIWKDFVTNVDTSSASSNKHLIKMQDIFQACLENIFTNNHTLLKQALKDSNFLAPLLEENSFCETGINKNDVGCTHFIFHKQSMKYVETRVNQILEMVDLKIKQLCQVNDEVTEMSVRKFMYEVNSISQHLLSEDSQYTIKTSLFVKLYIHISRYAHPIFESHNRKYFKTHGTAVRLDRYKNHQKIIFQSHLRCLEFENEVAQNFSNVIECFAEEWMFQSLPRKVTETLQSLLPKVKNRIIIELCTDLLEKGSFENFSRYIVDPYGYASSWITEEANRNLDAKIIANTSSSLLGELFGNINRCVKMIYKEYDGNHPPSINTLIESFQNATQSANVSIPSESFRIVRLETSSRIQNVEYLIDKLLEYLGDAVKRLATKFKSQKSKTITWVGFNPISRLIENIWGCQGQCAFCGEPCANNMNHEGSKHFSIQHRPLSCSGTYEIATKLACLESCNFKVQSNTTHTCSDFKYVCNNEKREKCGKTHYYKDFKTYLPDWDIPPSSNMHESSEYWMWFVATYKDELKGKYGYQIDHIPSSWSTITKSEAKASLHMVYA